MSAIFHHEDFLLNDAEIVTRFQFDDFDGGKGFSTVVVSVTIAVVAIIGVG